MACGRDGAAIAARLGVPIRLEPRLRERLLGTAEGRPADQVDPADLGVTGRRVTDPDAHPPGGESVRQLYDRATGLLRDLLHGDLLYGHLLYGHLLYGHLLYGDLCVAYVVTNPGDVSPGLPGKLLDRCRRALSPHQQPASVIVVDTLPAGPTGKPDRRALRAAAATAAAATAAAATAATAARDLAPAVRSAEQKQDRHLASHQPQLNDQHYEKGNL